MLIWNVEKKTDGTYAVEGREWGSPTPIESYPFKTKEWAQQCKRHMEALTPPGNSGFFISGTSHNGVSGCVNNYEAHLQLGYLLQLWSRPLRTYIKDAWRKLLWGENA